jgi:hypothetical protein
VELFAGGVLVLLGSIAVVAGLRGTQGSLVSTFTAPTPAAGTAPAADTAVHAVTHAPVMV